jgi:hypothetical protein
MSSIQDAKKACALIQKHLKRGNVGEIQRLLNEYARAPSQEARSYVKAYWRTSLRYGTPELLEHYPRLTLNQLGDWHCYKVDDPA